MAAINEDHIKTIALGFLRNHYKHRPRSGDMQARTDLRAEGNIVVDVQLSFPDEKGKNFTATVEATSVDTRKEVQFSVLHGLLFWDSLVFGFLAGIVYFLISSLFDTISIPFLSLDMRITYTAFSIIFSALAYYAFIRPSRRYRYIYAIAQFKKYHVNDQWIAMAKGVFPNLDKNGYYRELKRQCTHFGFGLLLIDQQNQVRLILSPARSDLFGKQRKEVDLLSLQNFSQLKNLKEQDWFFMKWWYKWTNPYRKQGYLRFKKGFFYQWGVIGLSTWLLFVLFQQELKRLPVYYPDEDLYQASLEQKARELKGEIETGIDSNELILPFGKNWPTEQIVDRNKKAPVKKTVVRPRSEVIIYDSRTRSIIPYDCERLMNFSDTKYLILVGQYDDQISAQRTLVRLGRKGLPGTVVWEGCFSRKQERFLLYLDNIFTTAKEARDSMESFREKLDQEKLRASIIPLSPLIRK